MFLLLFICSRKSIDLDYLLIRLEVGTAGTSGIRHPHPLGFASLGLGSFHVRQNNDTIKAVSVDVLRRSIEAGTAAEHTLGCFVLTLLPDVDLALINVSIEGHHRELCQLG